MIADLDDALKLLAGMPAPVSLDQAGYVLHARFRRLILPYTLDQADQLLAGLVETVAILRLYQQYFPNEWAGSSAAQLPGPGKLYSAREVEFFKLVHERLFPISEMWLEEAGDFTYSDADRSLEIPILGGEYAYEWEIIFEEEALGWQVLLLLGGVLEDDETAVEDFDGPDELYELLVEACGDRRLVADVCWKQVCAGHPDAEILGGLPQAMGMVAHDTGTVYLDSHYEAEMNFWWDQENIDYLTEDWRRAQEIEQKAFALVHWLEADEAHIWTMAELWGQAAELTAQLTAGARQLPLGADNDQPEEDDEDALPG